MSPFWISHVRRVIVSGDIVPRIPFDLGYGTVHGIGPRLLLQHGRRERGKFEFDPEADPYDRDQRWPFKDPKLHTCHSSLLAGVQPRGRCRETLVPEEQPWPVSSAACMPPATPVQSPRGRDGGHGMGTAQGERDPPVQKLAFNLALASSTADGPPDHQSDYECESHI